MPYVCNLPLRSLPDIELELHPDDDNSIVRLDFGDLRRPQGDPPPDDPLEQPGQTSRFALPTSAL
jgi:hypothetical protein